MGPDTPNKSGYTTKHYEFSYLLSFFPSFSVSFPLIERYLFFRFFSMTAMNSSPYFSMDFIKSSTAHTPTPHQLTSQIRVTAQSRNGGLVVSLNPGTLKARLTEALLGLRTVKN